MKPGSVSAMTGTSGRGAPRVGRVRATGRILPARIWGSDVLYRSKRMFTCPLSRSVSAGALPLYCTRIISVFVIVRSHSQPKVISPPPEAQVTLPGFAFAAAITSATVFGAKPGLATSA